MLANCALVIDDLESRFLTSFAIIKDAKPNKNKSNLQYQRKTDALTSAHHKKWSPVHWSI